VRRGGTINPGQVRPLGVQAERGFIEVVSPLQVKHAIRRADGGPLEIRAFGIARRVSRAHRRAAPRGLSIHGSALQFRNWPRVVRTGRDRGPSGRFCETFESDFSGRSSGHGRELLRENQRPKSAPLYVPKGVKLWEARVDHEVTTARVDGEQILVSLPARLNPNEPVAVALRLGPIGRRLPFGRNPWPRPERPHRLS